MNQEWMAFFWELIKFGIGVFLTHWVVKELLKLFPTVLRATDRRYRPWVFVALLLAVIILYCLHH